MFEEPRDDSMTTFMISNSFSGFLCDKLRLPFNSSYDPFCGKLKVNHGDGLLVASSCYNCGLVADVFDVSSTESWGQSCQSFGIIFNLYVRVKDKRLQMHLKNLGPSLKIGEVDVNKSIESTRTGKSLIENLLLIGSCKDYNVGVVVETVHFN